MSATDWPCVASNLRPEHLGSHVGVAGTLLSGRLMEVTLHESRPATVQLRLMSPLRTISVVAVAHDAIIVKRARQ